MFHEHSLRVGFSELHLVIVLICSCWGDIVFLYRAGAETLILVTGALGKLCPQAEKPKTAVYTQKNKKQRFRYTVLRFKPFFFSSGCQNCGLGIHR